MASTTLTKTFASTGNRKTWTFSAWVKRTSLSANVIFSSSLDGNNFGNIEIDNNNRKFQFSTWQSATTINLITSRVFRDTSAWYHIVVVVDTTQSTESNRVKLYVNGIQETVFDTAVYPSQNSDNVFNVSSYIHRIGVNSDNNGRYFDGLMSHIHFIDGTAYDASAFGQADANGVWTIKTSPSVTYGTNGFFILKNGNSVTDQSGNSNNWTVGGGTLTNTEDNPSNVFATLNSLNGVHYAGLGFSNGNNSITTTAGQYAPGLSTLGVSTGKWYGEFKMTSSSNWSMVGVTGQVATATDYSIGHGTTGYGYTGGSSASGQQSNNNSLSSYGDTYNNGDIIGIALDLDNNKLYFSKNGTWQNSGDPTSGATGTGAISISASPDTGFYHMGAGNYSGTQTPSWSANFGNGYFGTTAVASAGTNASGIGIFEYDVPTGYTALSTKGLNL
jgi:hypothetical protein